MHAFDPKFGLLTFIGTFGRLGRIYRDLKNKDVEYLSTEMGIVDEIDKKIQELISAIKKRRLQPVAIVRAFLLQSFMSWKSMKSKICIQMLSNGTKIQEGLIFSKLIYNPGHDLQAAPGLRRTVMRISTGTSENDVFLSFLKSCN